jgi:hypothetical protein
MAEQTPKAIVSGKCIAYSEALLQYRRSVVTDQQAIQEGHNLFAWFQGKGALANDEKAAIAARCVDRHHLHPRRLHELRLSRRPDSSAAFAGACPSAKSRTQNLQP